MQISQNKMCKKAHYIIFILSFLYIINVAFDRIKDGPRGVIWCDAEGYYNYLPALFILKDFHKLSSESIWPYYNDKGEFVNKYTCGVAYFELPFFGLGYLINKAKHADTLDYYSPVYSRSIAFGGVVITFLGLFLLFKVLLREFNENVAFWTIISIYLGTNLFYYSTKEMGMSHIYSFFLFTWFLYHIPRFLKSPQFLNSIVLGMITGWIILIRPTNAIIIVLVLLFNVYSIKSIKERIVFFSKNIRWVVIVAGTGFIMMIPQFLYWKEMTHHWIYYSYTSEGFKYWNHPKLLAVLFDIQNGLFLYSPLAILMVAGILYGLKAKKFHSPAMLIIFVVATYIFSRWWAWWFGGAFGHRSYIEYYGILAIPLAGLIQEIFSSKKKIVRISFQFLLTVMMIYS